MKGSAERMEKDVRVQGEEKVLRLEKYSREKSESIRTVQQKGEADVHEVPYCRKPTFQLQFSLFETRDLGSERILVLRPPHRLPLISSLFSSNTHNISVYIHSNAKLIHI
ncbi:hypothetical protein GOODEAATRI_004698 [Goodea atripinnis]|uniref:Uncharacterized protein n=1 Tax=Goodea atripinnis TaxID=208336 RepID=A0ABV0P1H3_9TELE